MQTSVRTPLRSRAAALVAAVAAVTFFIAPKPAAAAGGTAAGTAINNTATATYTDANATSYTSQSNTVALTVQNAPALTISPTSGSPGNNTVSPGATITDTYTLANVGNSTGYFQLTGTENVNDGVTAGQGTATAAEYVVSVAGGPTQTFANLAAVNTYLSSGNSGGPFTVPAASGAPVVANEITIGVTYAAAAGASGTITTKLSTTITQPAAGGASAQTSAAANGQYNDTVTSDARLDIQKSASVGGTVAAPTVTYTVNANNGGSRAMTAVNAAGLPSGANGGSGNGIVITDKLPSYNSTQLTLNGTPTFSKQPTGATFIYSTNGTSWTTTSAGAAYVGVFVPASAITGSFGASNPGSSQGSVTAAQAQLTFSYTINGSTASGSANATAITNVANGIFGDSSGYIEGPGIALYSVPNTGAATASQTAPAIANTNGTLNGSGAFTSAASPSNNVVLNGPSGNPGATGPSGTTSTDYTVLSYTNGGAVTASVNGSTVTVPANAASITFTNTVQNTGNVNDIYNLTAANVPAGWTAQFQNMSGTVITNLAVASGASVSYKVILTPGSSATTFNAYNVNDVAVTATSTNNPAISDITNDDLIVGGFVQLSKAASVASGIPCSTATAGNFTASAQVRPGDCVQYVVTYTNVAPSGGTNNATLAASNVVITESGAASGGSGSTTYTNSWSTYSNGLYNAPTDSGSGTVGGYVPTAGTAPGSTAFTDTIASLAAGASGSVTFKVQVK